MSFFVRILHRCVRGCRGRLQQSTRKRPRLNYAVNSKKYQRTYSVFVPFWRRGVLRVLHGCRMLNKTKRKRALYDLPSVSIEISEITCGKSCHKAHFTQLSVSWPLCTNAQVKRVLCLMVSCCAAIWAHQQHTRTRVPDNENCTLLNGLKKSTLLPPVFR